MPCTTVLVGRKASNDGSTMVARTEDAFFAVKKTIVVEPKDQPKKYKTAASHLEIELTEKPMRYTASPNVDTKDGAWYATGINAANVGMTATETITSNPRVLAADPLVKLQKAKKRGEKEIPGGIGEEDFVLLVLPYAKTARDGAARLGALLEKYGTYEMNGIAFNDEKECWWLETIGGHHWIAKRVPDDVVVIAPNQFGLDNFDLEDALGAQKDHMCSADMKEFIEKYHLDCNQNGKFSPRDVFGSHSDKDHLYNTPRAWFMGRYLCPWSHTWDGEDAEFKPESDDIPWALVPDRKVTVEDVKYLLSGNFQGTPYNPYSNQDTGKRGIYRSIGINRTGVSSICQIRPDVPDPIKGIEWIFYGSSTFDAALPIYTNVPDIPKYLKNVTLDCSTDNFYWASRLIAAMADSHYATCIQLIERYQNAVMTRARQIVLEYDEKMIKSKDFSLTAEANEKLAAMAREETTDCLNKVLFDATSHMKNGYNRADN